MTSTTLPALPETPSAILPALSELTTALGIPREILASNEEIEYAWQGLPRELKEIPEEHRGELVARMCVAVSVGLFDGAINYIWNAAILRLRDKVRSFGLPVVAQILQKDFEEKDLVESIDHQLLELCLKLNILDEDGYFFLDQCRATRNNFSAAHPSIGPINDREFSTFLNRCSRYALSDLATPKGVALNDFIGALKGARFNESQLSIWVQRLNETYDAQRQMLINMTHGIYCDPATPQPSRLNCIDLCEGLKERFSNAVKHELVNNHYEYVTKGVEDKHTASIQFFEKLGLVGLLNEAEQHSIFSKAIERLWNTHNSMNNFYNEAPFAERLNELTQSGAVPETAQDEFVQTVACCRVGNGYGTADAAVRFYNDMIRSFSPREITVLIRAAKDENSKLGRRLKLSPCKRNFKSLLGLIAPESVPSGVKSDFDYLIR